MDNGLISLIIPVYNRESYLDRCIQSALDQQDVRTEIIIVDDGSTDKSPEILDDYSAKYSNIHVIHNHNHGAAYSRNCALDIATGDYISFLDSDDYLEPDSLKCLLQALLNNNVDMVIGAAALYSTSGEIIEFADFNRCPEIYRNKVITPRETYEMVVNLQNLLSSVIWARIYKKEVWDNVRFPIVRKSEDNMVMPQIVENCKSIYTLDKIIYNQTLSDNSIMRGNNERSSIGTLDAYLIEMDYLLKKNYYDVARYRFGQGSRLLIHLTESLSDNESKMELASRYKQYKEISKTLAKHANPKDKIRYSLFRTNLAIYDQVRKKFAKG